MLVFSSLNLGLDILNVTCFARAKKLFGFVVPEMNTSLDHLGVHQQIGHNGDGHANDGPFVFESRMESATRSDELSDVTPVNNSFHPRDHTGSLIKNDSSTDSAEREANEEPAHINNTDTADCARRDASGVGVDEVARKPDPDDSANLNMCSAYTVITSTLL